ncbi:MAG: hypothetical protein V4496_05520 [Pseudomonadota bacterium]
MLKMLDSSPTDPADDTDQAHRYKQALMPENNRLFFTCTNLPESTSDNDLLMHFFLDNITLLKNLHASEERETVQSSIESWWQFFINNRRCPKEIKDRNIVLSKNAAVFTIINIISKICKPNLVDSNIISAFSKLLSNAAKDEKFALLTALSKALFTDPDKEKEISETGNIIIEHMHVMQVKIALAMLYIQASSIPKNQKLEFIIASANIEVDYKNEELVNAYNHLQIILEKARKEVSFEKSRKKNLPALVKEYSLHKQHNSSRDIISIILAIEDKCTEKQLAALAKELEKFSILYSGPKFFDVKTISSDLQHIINMIEKKLGAFDILLELKQTAQHVQGDTKTTESIAQLYQVIHHFFSAKETEQGATMDDLLNSMAQISIDCANINLIETLTPIC